MAFIKLNQEMDMHSCMTASGILKLLQHVSTFRFDSPHLLKHIQRRKPVHKKQSLLTPAAQNQAAAVAAQSLGMSQPQSSNGILGLASALDQDPSSSSALYKCLLTEIAKLQKQNGETQNTIQQLKEVHLSYCYRLSGKVLLQSKSREEQLETRIQKISDFLHLKNEYPRPAPQQQQYGTSGVPHIHNLLPMIDGQHTQQQQQQQQQHPMQPHPARSPPERALKPRLNYSYVHYRINRIWC